MRTNCFDIVDQAVFFEINVWLWIWRGWRRGSRYSGTINWLTGSPCGNDLKSILIVWQTGMACQANHVCGQQQNPFRARTSKPAGTRKEARLVAHWKPVEPKLTRSFASSNPFPLGDGGCQDQLFAKLWKECLSFNDINF